MVHVSRPTTTTSRVIGTTSRGPGGREVLGQDAALEVPRNGAEAQAVHSGALAQGCGSIGTQERLAHCCLASVPSTATAATTTATNATATATAGAAANAAAADPELDGDAAVVVVLGLQTEPHDGKGEVGVGHKTRHARDARRELFVHLSAPVPESAQPIHAQVVARAFQSV